MSYDPRSPAPYPYAQQPPPPPGSNTWLYVLLGVAGFMFLSCAGCAGVMWFAASTSVKMANSGMQYIAEHVGKQLQPQLQADPVIQQHIGTISSAEMSIQDAISEKSKFPERHKERTMGIKVKGSKGEGLVMCRTDSTNPDNPRILEGELCLPNGEYHRLAVKPGSKN
jgi:hypothetical protein